MDGWNSSVQQNPHLGNDDDDSVELDVDNKLETPYVEIYFDPPPPKMPPIPPPPDLMPTPGGPIVVRTEEALIVIFVLILWVAAIALFFNRWGKIRMLEPYQPKFHEEHRTSCPMVEYQIAGGGLAHCQHRTSVSKYAVNTVNLEAAPMPSSIFPTINPTYRNLSRPRQNSVFTEPKTFPAVENPRKVKSAMDIQSLILNEMTPYRGSRSMIPIGDRRTSCFGNFVSPSHDRRPSCCLYPPVTEFRRHSGDLLCYKDRPHLAPNFVPVAARRPSCCVGVGDYFPTRKMSCVGGDNILPTTAGVTSSLLKSPIADAAKKEREKERERWDGPSTSTAGPSGTRKTSVSADLLAPLKSLTKDRRTSFNNVLAQVTSERRASSSILRLASNVSNV